MNKITLISDVSGERLDVFLTANIPDLTRNAAQKLLENKNVTLNGCPVKKNHRTADGERYEIIQNEPDDSVVSGQNIPLDIVFEDNCLVIVNKPRGMVVHPAPGHPDGTLVNALLHHCGDSLSGIGGIIRPGIVHRIDKDTSGLVIAAKNDRAHLSLASQLSSRTLTREYQAVVCGNVKSDSGTIDVPIGRHPTDRKKQSAFPQREHRGTVLLCSRSEEHSRTVPPCSRSAVTHFEVIDRYNGYTHVRCRLETGRTHQIRVHMAHIGHPILGDIVYGRKKPELGMSSQCLHAQNLCFTHPTTGEHIELCADLPDYFIEIIRKLDAKS